MKANDPSPPGAKFVRIAAFFSVLAEPTRLEILQLLQASPHTVSELVERLHVKQANVSKQLGILTTHGLIERKRSGNFAIYSIRAPLVRELCGLVCGHFAEEGRLQTEIFTEFPAPRKRRSQTLKGTPFPT